MRSSFPDFATPTADGFGATKEEYAGWLTEEVRAFGEPVDLVGHDWGSILVQRVASTHPELIRTLACGSGPADRAYEWHAMAQLWQTPAAGEEVVERNARTADRRPCRRAGCGRRAG